MTTDQTVEETVSAMKGYLGLKYETYQDFEDDLVAQIVAQNLSTEEEAAVIDYIQTEKPHEQFFLPDIPDHTKEFLLDTYLSGAGEFLEWYGQQAKTFVTQSSAIVAVQRQTSLGTTLDIVFADALAVTNKTFPAVSTLGKVMAASTIPIAIGLGAYEYYNAENPNVEALKQYTIFAGSALAAGAAAGGLITFAATLGVTVPAAVIFGVGAGVGYISGRGIEAVWDSIPAIVDAAKAAGKTALEAAQDVIDALTDTALAAFDAIGDAADAFLEGGANFIDDLIDDIPATATELPSWLKTSEQLESDLGLDPGDLAVTRALPGNDWMDDRLTVLDDGTQMFSFEHNDIIFLPDNGAPNDNDVRYALGVGVSFGDEPITEMEYFFYDSQGNLITGLPTNDIFDFSTDFSQGLTDTGSDITDQDWQNGIAVDNGTTTGWVDPAILNTDGFFNVVPSSIVTDGYRPGAETLWGSAEDIFHLGISLDNITEGLANLGATFVNTSAIFGPGIGSLVTAGSALLTGVQALASQWLNIDPVVMDLDGDGVELIGFEKSHAVFDVDNDGFQENTGWVSADDAILVRDLNGDGVINNITETLSEFYNGGDYEDGLAALATLDTNSDNVFDTNDAAFGSLRAWQDANGDGQTNSGELKTLAALGITSIDLNREIATREELEGNPVLSRSTMVINGLTHEVAAVDFTTNPLGYEWNDIVEGVQIITEDASASSLLIGDTNGATIDVANLNVEAIIGNIGDDVITGDGNDNWLMGGGGSDTLTGGAGNDLLIVDSEDDTANIDAGAGLDIVQVSGAAGVVLTLSEVNAEVAIGGDGHDTLISGSTSNVFMRGGAGDDVLIGGSADDALSGEDGDDMVDGGLGDDILRGHRGQDLLIGDDGEDMLDGGLDDDALYGGSGEDLLIGGAGNDRLYGGMDYDVAEFSGTLDEYDVTVQGDGTVQVKDRVLGRDGADILTDVEALNFKNVKEVSLNLQGPLTSNDILSISGSGPYTILASTILANDIDYQGNSLHITSVTDVAGGTAQLDGNGNIIFTPDPSYKGVRSFKYTVEDSEGNAGALAFSSATGDTEEVNGTVYLKEDHHPDDPLFYAQWYLSDANIIPVWNDYTGEGVNIAVYEVQGIMDTTHPDLVANLDQETLDSDAQSDWHATLVSGVIAASRNGEGSVGVAYDATLEGVHFQVEVDGGFFTADQADEFLHYDIVNNSWGWTEPFIDNFNEFPAAEQNVFTNAVSLGREGLGTIIVFAGGNSRDEGGNANVNSWQNSENVITVGGINKVADLASLELYQAPFSDPGANLLISAPASHIQSTALFLENVNGSTFGHDYDLAEGTSFSTPIVSGVVALMLEANPELGYRDVQEILAYSARIVDDADTSWQTNGAANWNGGGLHFSHDYGFGAIDAVAAVRLAETWHKQEAEHNKVINTVTYDGSVSDQTIPDNGTLTDTISIPETGLGPIEFVKVTLDFIHPQVGDLIIKLVSPHGTESILLDRLDKAPNDPNDFGHGAEDMVFTFGSWIHMGELSEGTWTLEITDAAGGSVGTLRSWKIDFTFELPDYYAGEVPPANSTYIFTDEYLELTDTSRWVLQDGAMSEFEDDTLNVAAMTGNVDINLTPGTTSSLSGKDLEIASGTIIDRLFTGDGNDTLTGNEAHNLLYGGRGDDIISGGPGNDWLLGKAGNDAITGGAGEDKFVVQKGDAGEHLIQDFNLAEDKITIANYDSLEFSDLTLVPDDGNTRIALPEGEEILLVGIIPSSITESHFSFEADFNLRLIRLNESTYSIGSDNVWFGDIFNGTAMYGLEGDDQLLGTFGNDTIYGGLGNDILVGSYSEDPEWSNTTEKYGGEDVLYGNEGDDTLYGGGMRDTLIGGTGNDFLYGNRGDDIIHIEGGRDSAWGHEGRDIFIIHQATAENIALGDQHIMDVIADFNPEDEQIDLRLFPNVRSWDDLVFDTGTLNVTDPDTGQTVPTPVLLVAWGNSEIEFGANQYFTLLGLNDSAELNENNFIFSTDALPEPALDIYVLDEDATLSFTTVDLLANDADAEDGVPEFTKIVAGPEHGTLAHDGFGNYTYTPDADYHGTDSFVYEVKDNNGGTATSAVAITINSVDDAPETSLPDTVTFRTGLLVSYKALFSDPDGDLLTYTAELQYGSPLPSWLTFDPQTQRLTGIAPNLPEDVLLTFTASDGSNETNHNITLSVVTRAPVAKDDVVPGTEDQPISGNVLADNGNGMDTDFDGDNLSVQEETITSVQGGTVATLANGNFIYTPAANFSGEDSFTYTLLDGQGGTDTGTVTITVNAVNDAPVLTNTGGSVDEDGMLTLTTGLLNATDVDNIAAELVFTVDVLPANGVLMRDGIVLIATESFTLQDITAGLVTYEPDANYNGADSFDFTLSDGTVTLPGETFTIAVDPVNDAPVAQDDSFTGLIDQNVTGENLLANNGNGADTDIDGDTPQAQAETKATDKGGSVTIAVDGTFTYTPATGFTGQDTFTYTVVDGNGGSAVGTATIEVTATNGDDTLIGTSGDDNLSGLGGNDTLIGVAGDDILTGGAGNDTVNYSGAAAGVIVNLNTGATSNDGDGGTDTLSSIENVIGSEFNDVITGSSVANNIDGRGGNDIILGAAEADTLSGGDGDDLIFGNLGNDTIDGGDGTDTVSYSLSFSGVTVDLDSGTASGDGTDTLLNLENVTGSALIDTITGDGGANVLNGLGGWDTLLGLDGDDTIYGDAGIDLIGGGAGNDLIDGGAGADVLYGGTEADTFLFLAATAYDGVDTVKDFSTAQGDKLDLSDLLSGAYDPLTQAITDFVEITDSGSDTVVKVDADGTGAGASFVQIATLEGITGLTDEAALELAGTLITA